jgi:hypothetical protein
VNLEITSMKNDYTSKLNCLVLPRITSKMPMTDIDISTWKFPSDVVLADRDFNKSAPIDILLGAEIFCEILMTDSTGSTVELGIGCQGENMVTGIRISTIFDHFSVTFDIYTICTCTILAPLFHKTHLIRWR